MVAGDRFVGNDDCLTPPHQRQDLAARPFEQAGTDQDVVAAVAEFDAQLRVAVRRGLLRAGHAAISGSGGRAASGQAASAAMTRVVVSSAAPSPLSTTMSASA